MTRQSVREDLEAVRPRYRMAGKVERGQILDEVCRTTGYHRKSAVRVLGGRSTGRPPTQHPHGRPRSYGPEVARALKEVWEASDRLCSKRLAPFLAEFVASLERHGRLALAPEVREKLVGLSPATIDRLLASGRPKGRWPFTQGPASSRLKAQIPLRTFGEWAAVAPGALQADLVAHCGESTDGFYLTTLNAVDVATGWTECQAIWGKGQERVGAGLHSIRARLPFALRQLHTDNGSEFLNGVVYPWCTKHGIRLTRGRPYKKNDQAYAEQKNWAVVRRLVGDDRYASKAAYTQLERLYRLVRLFVNYFQPIRKLVSKERAGTKVVKRFDQAQTPYQRVRAAAILTDDQRQALAEEYTRLDPVRLREQIDQALATLWDLADHRQASTAEPTKAAG